MISNTAQINTFVEGMNLDTDVNLIPNSQYRYAENVRVITNDNGTTGVLQNIEGVRRYSTVLPTNETIIGTTTVKDIGIVITRLENGFNKIYRVQGFDTNMPTVDVVCQGDLGLCQDLTKTPTLSIVANYESDTNIKIYFTDGTSSMKVLNVASDKYHAGSNLVDYKDNIINPGAIDTTPDAELSPFKFIKSEEGNLKAGMVAYCYQLFNVHNTETVLSPLSELIHVAEGDTSSGSQKYKGTGYDKNAGKSVTIKAKLHNNDFDKIRIIRVAYYNNTSIPEISIIDEVDLTYNQKEIVYTDYGLSYLSELTIDEFNALLSYQFTPQTLAKMNNRLFAANITEQSWTPKDSNGNDYDARTYRANNKGIAKLESSSNNKSLYIDITDNSALFNVPSNHDCINPFNNTYFNSVSEEDRYIYNSKGQLGGSGINIDYQFITTDIKLSKQQKQERLDQDCTMDVPSERIEKVVINKTNNTSDTIKLYSNIAAKRTPNYTDPYIDANFRGYQRDEIYRFGIVFYNKKNVPSPVLWIGDIRMPHSSQMPPFVYENNTLVGKALGIEFTVRDIPEEAVSYEIVRCDRTESDRTILMQAIGSFVYQYKIQEQDQEVGKGPTLDNSIELRPTPYFSNYDGDVFIDTSSRRTGKLPKEHINKNYIRLVSPEICIQGQYIESIMKDRCQLDIQGSYYSSITGGIGRSYIPNIADDIAEINASQFASASWVKQTDDTILYQDTITTCSFFNSLGDPTVRITLPIKNTENKLVYYQPIIAKYFNPKFSGFKGNAYIEDAKYPLNIDYNVTKGVTANRINVGVNTYTNYSMSNFFESDGQSVMGPSGPCIVAHAPTLYKIFSGYQEITQSSGGDRSIYDIINAIPVFNIKRDSVTQYSGNTYSSRQNSVYISTSKFDKYTFGGDTYLSLLDYPNTMIFQLNQEEEWENKKFFIGSYIPFESTINMNLFQGDQAHRTSDDSNYLDSHMQLQPTQIGQYHIQELPYYLYNAAYSVRNTVKKFVPKSMYAEDDNKFGNRIMASQVKTNNEVIDQFTKFKVADYLDVDNQYGDITNLKVFKDRLFYFQDSSVGIAAVNERSLITDDNVNQITLGTGGILSRYDYITNTNGSSIINDRSIINSDNVLYWYDYDKNEICCYTGQISQISKEKQVQSYLNDNYKIRPTDANSLFDKKYNEVWFRFLDKSLIFNEQLGRFTSFYTFNPKWSLTFSDRLVGIKNNNLYSINDTNTKGEDTTDRDAKLTIVVNKDSVYTKVFDNIRFQGRFEDKNNNIVKDNIFDSYRFSTKSQEAIRDKEPIVVDYREDTYRFPVPRADKNEDELSLPARMRGKYMVCDYHFDGTDNHTFEIPQITTTYRYSLI